MFSQLRKTNSDCLSQNDLLSQNNIISPMSYPTAKKQRFWMIAEFVQHYNSPPNLFLTNKSKYLFKFHLLSQTPSSMMFFPTILQMPNTVFTLQFKCLTVFAEFIATGFEILNLIYAANSSLKYITDIDIHVNIEIVQSNNRMISKL